MLVAPIVELPSVAQVVASTTEIAQPWLDTFEPFLWWIIGIGVVGLVFGFAMRLFHRD